MSKTIGQLLLSERKVETIFVQFQLFEVLDVKKSVKKMYSSSHFRNIAYWRSKNPTTAGFFVFDFLFGNFYCVQLIVHLI